MEIIERAKPEVCKFRIIKSILKFGKTIEAGEEVELNKEEQPLYVSTGKAVPCDIPEVGVYICLRSFSLPGSIEKFEAKQGDLVSLLAKDALRLMIDGYIIPKNNSQWRPHGRKLRKGPDRTEEEQAALAEAAFQGKLMEMGLGPYKSRK